MAVDFDVNDPDIQRAIRRAMEARNRPKANPLISVLFALLLITMISAFAILAAPHAVSLWLWYQEGKPVADAPAQPTGAPLPTAAVARPPSQPARQVIVPQQPAQPVQEAPTQPPPDPTQAPALQVDAGINGSGPYIAVSVPQAPPAQVEQPAPPPTPYPEPGQPGFEESFARPDPAQTCMFIGCLRAPQPTPWPTTTFPQPGEPGFNESFEGPGDQ
jgi:hypothetical protein